MDSELEILTRNVSKSFGEQEVLRQCDLQVARGSIYGVLGPNGAGKTTLFKIILGLLQPSAGVVEVRGLDSFQHRKEVLRSIGSIIEVPLFYEHLSAADNLALHLEYMGTPGRGIPEVLEMVGLPAVRQQPVSSFSLGMRQRLGLARAIVHQPRLLILDEPTNGLDPLGIREIRELLRELNRQGVTILLASHILSEVEEIADTIGVMVGGQLVEEISHSQLQQGQGTSLEDYFFDVLRRGGHHA